MKFASLPTESIEEQLSVRKRNGSVMKIPLENVQQIVDTCLLKTFLATNETLVGSLVRVQNYCNIEETEQLLIEFRKFHELIDFYFSKGLHFKALALLKKLLHVANSIDLERKRMEFLQASSHPFRT